MAAAARILQENQTNGGTHHIQKPKLSVVSCSPTLPESAVVTPSARGPRQEGQRNLQDSTFSISGEEFIPINCFFCILFL